MAKQVSITPKAANTVVLRLNGQVFTGDSLDLAGKLNSVIAYWNSYLELNKQPDPAKKIHAVTGGVNHPQSGKPVKSAKPSKRDKRNA
jgi:hypothetical protein